MDLNCLFSRCRVPVLHNSKLKIIFYWYMYIGTETERCMHNNAQRVFYAKINVQSDHCRDNFGFENYMNNNRNNTYDFT